MSGKLDQLGFVLLGSYWVLTRAGIDAQAFPTPTKELFRQLQHNVSHEYLLAIFKAKSRTVRHGERGCRVDISRFNPVAWTAIFLVQLLNIHS
jgi:hypothetical protein